MQCEAAMQQSALFVICQDHWSIDGGGINSISIAACSTALSVISPPFDVLPLSAPRCLSLPVVCLTENTCYWQTAIFAPATTLLLRRIHQHLGRCAGRTQANREHRSSRGTSYYYGVSLNNPETEPQGTSPVYVPRRTISVEKWLSFQIMK